MMTYKKITVTKEVEMVDDIICNKCGESLVHIVGDDTDVTCGLPECYVEGGYYSPCIEDGVSYSFDLCERCVLDLMKEFKHPAKRKDWNERD